MIDERFWAKADQSGGPRACWPWTAYVSVGGYGKFKLNGSMRYAHRVAWELVHGPIPNGLTLDHLCRTTRCVNPAHLEPVTSRVNILRGTGPVAVNARRVLCKNGHPLDGDNLSRDHRRHRRCRACNADYMRRRRAEAVAA